MSQFKDNNQHESIENDSNDKEIEDLPSSSKKKYPIRSQEMNDDDDSTKVKKVKLDNCRKNDTPKETQLPLNAKNLIIPSSLNLALKNESQEIRINIDENDYENILNISINPAIDRLLMSENFTLRIIASFINNSFKKDLDQIKILTDQAYNKIRHGYFSNQSDDIPLEIIYSLLHDSIKDEVNMMASLLRSIPAFAKLDLEDFSCIVKNKLLPYTILKYYKLKIDNECYSVFKNGLQCTRSILDRMGNILMNDMNFQICKMLNELNLNEKEYTALMTFILSFPRHINIKDLNSIIEFNQLVGKILANELFASKRNQDYVLKMRKIIVMIEKIQEFNIWSQS